MSADKSAGFDGYNRPLGRLLVEDYAVTAEQMAAALGWGPDTVEAFVLGEREVDAGQAALLGSLCRCSPGFLLNLQSSYHRLR